MAKIVCVHGIGQQYRAEDLLAEQWPPALRGGLRRSGAAGVKLADALHDTDFRYAFYGDVFRPAGRALGPGDSWLDPEDATEFEQELALMWWEAAAEVDPDHVIHPDARTLARSSRSLQAALRALSMSAFFVNTAERFILGDLVQVRRYFTEPSIRAAVQQRLADAVGDDTAIVVGHSLGSVVAYEGLCAHPEWKVRTLITLGSPLGIRNLIFDRLQPAPSSQPSDPRSLRGYWPGSAAGWTNVSDAGDLVALIKDLRPLFGPRVSNWTVHNGATAHAVEPYLTAAETGAAILAGLTQPGSLP